VCAFILSSVVVESAGMLGAAVLYLALTAGVAFIFAGFVLFGIRKSRRLQRIV
jgi:hypothetical protein